MFHYTALHQAASSGKVEDLDYLLKRTGNAHVNSRANSGYTPLHLAASSGHKDCVRLLIEHGADINTVDEYEKAPWEVAEIGRAKEGIIRLFRSEGK